MNETAAFQPDWVSPPGDTIVDILNERGLSVTELAAQLEQPKSFVEDLIEGCTPVTLEAARLLESTLGGTVTFWMSRDYRYRENVTRLLKDEGSWLREVPVRDMSRWGWIPKRSRPDEELAACLRFFGVQSVGAWRKEYAQINELVAFKASRSLDSKPAAVAAWLRRGELEARAIQTKSWNVENFREALGSIRALTLKKSPEQFIPALRDECAIHGVAVAVVRAPTGCRTSGATRFLSGNKAMLLLSYRHLTFDHFWFSFFHEAGHLILHDKSALFLEGLETQSPQLEAEADSFAEDILIPRAAREGLDVLAKEPTAIMRFAKKVGISPGIVVGQMEYRGLVRHGRFNRLKRRFSLD